MKKLVLVLLAIMLASALIFVGCAAPTPTPAPAPAPAPSPTTAPAPKPSPTTAPAPVPSPTTAPAPAKVIELKFAHHNPPTAFTTSVWLNPWAKKVEEATKGRVKVTMYPSRSLVAKTESYTAVQYGVADITWVVAGLFPGRFPMLDVITLPFLYLPEAKVNGEIWGAGKVNGVILQEAFDKLPEMQAEFKEVKVLYIATSEVIFPSTKKPIKTVADFKGMKIRAKAGGQAEALKALGGVPVNLQIPEQYEAAQRGVIDGTLAGWSSLATYKLYEVFSQYSTAGFMTEDHAIIMNKDKWNSLGPELQAAVMSVSGVEGAKMAGSTCWGPDAEKFAFDAMKKAGKEMTGTEMSPEELQKMKDLAGKPLWDAWVKTNEAKGLPAQKVLDEILALQKKYSK